PAARLADVPEVVRRRAQRGQPHRDVRAAQLRARLHHAHRQGRGPLPGEHGLHARCRARPALGRPGARRRVAEPARGDLRHGRELAAAVRGRDQERHALHPDSGGGPLMLILDTALARREAEGRPIRVGMIGAGFMGRGLANQIINSVPGMTLVAIANRTGANAERAYTEAGVEPVRVENADQVDAAIEKGTPAVLEDAFELLKAVHLDCVVDVTGAVEFGARVTVAAIERGLPVVTMNAELDGTVGPLLAHRAREAGVVLTGADGDQPAVQANLVRFVKGI